MSDVIINQNKLKIQFHITHSDGRELGFDGDISLFELRDWMDRTAQALLAIFTTQGHVLLMCTERGPNYINAIKQVRQESQIGLKDAKDFIEGLRPLKMKSQASAQKVITATTEANAVVIPVDMTVDRLATAITALL